MLKKLSKICATAAILTMTAGTLAAATYTETVSFSGVTSQRLNFLGFDASRGALTGVSATFSGTANIAAGTILGVGEDFGGEWEFDSSLDAAVEARGPFSWRNSFFGPGAYCRRLSPGVCTASYWSDAQAFSNAATATMGQLPLFGSSGFLFDVGISPEYFTSYGSFASGSSTPWTITGDVTVTYTFDAVAPVPLPAALPMLLAGLAGLVGLRFRRRA